MERSLIWKHFEVIEPKKVVQCLLCSTSIQVNNSARSILLSHLRVRHHLIYTELIQKKNPTIPKTTKEEMDEELVKMIALDFQPLDVLEHVGFHRFVHKLNPKYQIPSKHYVQDVLLPRSYDNVRTKVRRDLPSSNLAITLDIWTNNANQAFLTLTVQYIKNWKLHIRNLGTESLPPCYTDTEISSKMEFMFSDWNVPSNEIICATTDNGANIASAVKNHMRLPHLSCMAHSLQIMINHSLKIDSSIEEMLNLFRKIVGHLSHSSKATLSLKQIQQEMGIPVHMLVQEMETRWSSTLLLVQHMNEQKDALRRDLMDSQPSLLPTIYQWTLSSQLERVLKPLKTATDMLQQEKNCTISLAIPTILKVIEYLESHQQLETSVENVKKSLISGLQAILADLGRNSTAIISSFLDPRFKTHVMKQKFEANWFETLCEELTRLEIKQVSSEFLSFWQDDFAELGKEKFSIQEEIDIYVNLMALSPESNPFHWWHMQEKQLPHLSKMAEKYLAIPATNAASERVFSSTGNMYTKKRSKLDPQIANQLIFLNNNLGHLEEEEGSATFLQLCHP